VSATGERPLRADARRNRERILEAARAVFAADGLAVPVDAIALRAGVGVGTVYRHFPTKEALYEAIVLAHVQTLVEAARAGLEREDAGAAFFELLTAMSERGATDMALVDALTAAGYDIAEAGGEAKRELALAMAALLQRAQAAGAVRPDVTVEDVFALLAGVCRRADRDAGDPRRVRIAVAVVIDGLRAQPGG
jgi:AcrR family transcriptional regulator